ncbi:MAG: response regulator transcription factor, partial [Chloroflexi bacterium]|nr:response regulator transcription factor [Chloroflexota bacterium]
MKGPIGVILADDNTLFRAGLRSLLEKVPGVVVLAEAADGEEAVECVGRFHPRVVLMDLSMPRLNGLEATQRIKQKSRKVRV